MVIYIYGRQGVMIFNVVWQVLIVGIEIPYLCLSLQISLTS